MEGKEKEREDKLPNTIDTSGRRSGWINAVGSS
jgi:hypothetical protein